MANPNHEINPVGWWPYGVSVRTNARRYHFVHHRVYVYREIVTFTTTYRSKEGAIDWITIGRRDNRYGRRNFVPTMLLLMKMNRYDKQIGAPEWFEELLRYYDNAFVQSKRCDQP